MSINFNRFFSKLPMIVRCRGTEFSISIIAVSELSTHVGHYQGPVDNKFFSVINFTDHFQLDWLRENDVAMLKPRADKLWLTINRHSSFEILFFFPLKSFIIFLSVTTCWNIKLGTQNVPTEMLENVKTNLITTHSKINCINEWKISSVTSK